MGSGLQSLLIGTYTQKLAHVDGHADGILSAQFDGTSMSTPVVAAEVENPSWVTPSADGRFVYAIIETVMFEGKPSGGVAAYARNPETGHLVLLNKVPSAGTEPAHVELDPSGRFLVVANYGNGSVSVFNREKDGSIGKMVGHVQHAGSSAHPIRQTGPHAHQILFDPMTKDLLVSDLGIDTVFVYRLENDGTLTERTEARIKTAAGAGPRHLTFHPDGRHLFLLNELDNTLMVLRRNGDRFEQVQVLSTLPADFKGHSQASAIRVSKSGNYVLASNRGFDSIAMFAFDALRSRVELKLIEPSLGLQPRDFIQTPDGKHILVGNQDSDSVVVFALDEAAPSLKLVSQTSVPTPVCLRFVS